MQNVSSGPVSNLLGEKQEKYSKMSSPKKAIWMKWCQSLFSGKNQEKYFICWLLNVLPSMLSFKATISYGTLAVEVEHTLDTQLIMLVQYLASV